ncbi:MAG: IucA/IucC family protein [Exilibacterium sp.]
MKLTNKRKEPPPSVAPSLNSAAAHWILRELFDALIQENLFGLQHKSSLEQTVSPCPDFEDFTLGKDELYLRYPLAGSAGEIVCRVKKQLFIQPYRISQTPVLHIQNGHAQALDATGLMSCLVTAVEASLLPDTSGLDRFMRDLSLAEAQTSLTLESIHSIVASLKGGKIGLAKWEALAAIRDRPFHPLARTKSGLAAEDYRNFGSEFGRTFSLDWIVIRNTCLVGDSRLRGVAVAQEFLQQREVNVIKDSMAARALNFDSYTVIPVHPWQMRNHVVHEFAEEMARGDCVVVAENLGDFCATSSIRSLAPAQSHSSIEVMASKHIKLPMAIAALGAQRILPPRYLHNGASAQSVLQAIFEREPRLGECFYCDETRWLGFAAVGESMLSNRAGHLSCLIRNYPAVKNADELMPMSALTVICEGKIPALEWIARYQVGEQLTRQDLTRRIFEQICRRLTALSFTCFSYGVMPEVHGQNVVLSFNGGNVNKLILRDHDTLRLLPPWMRQAGIEVADYIMDWSTLNSLICLSPQELLRYFQTLGVQVNLYAIADSFTQAYGIEMSTFWKILKRTCEEQLQTLEIPVFVKAILRKELLDSPVWPTRLLLTPYLVHRARQTGMPSGIGSTRNPLMSEVL